MKGSYVLLLVAASVGSTAAVAHAQFSRETVPVPPPRAYLCLEGKSAAELTKKSSEAGARGWRMVAGAGTDHTTIFCFEQYLAARPREK